MILFPFPKRNIGVISHYPFLKKAWLEATINLKAFAFA